MKIESKEVRIALRDIRKKYGTRMKVVREAYNEFGTDYTAIEAKVKELHEAEFGAIEDPQADPLA